jgi:diguanylate cyclase (GGDEF)-like protein
MLLGDPGLRPDGLERALVRSGFQVAEADLVPGCPPEGPLPECVLVTAADGDGGLGALLGELDPAHWRGIPVVALLTGAEPGAVGSALRLGCADALAGPVDLAELCARIEARVRGRGDVESLRDASRIHDLMFDIMEDLSAALRPDEVVQTLVRRVGETLAVAHCSFIRVADDGEAGRVVASHELPTLRDLRVDLARYPEIGEALRTGEAVYVADVHRHPLFEGQRLLWAERRMVVDVRSVLAVPVTLHGRKAGVFLLRTRRDEEPLASDQVDFAVRLTHAASRVLESEERRASIYRRQGAAASLDPLTGCGSLDALDRRLKDEFERSRRYALSFSLVLFDVDGFRRINDRRGAEAGDRVLAELGALLQRELRAPDFVSRYGGDEFALVLPETDLDGARRSVTRVRAQVLAHEFPHLEPEERPRLSAGIVTFPHPSAAQPEDLLALVEAALLRGKAQSEERIGTAESVAT